MFVVFINDLPDVVRSIIKLFADDTKLFRTIQTIEDDDILQQDLDNLVKWSYCNALRFIRWVCFTWDVHVMALSWSDMFSVQGLPVPYQ